MSERSGDEDLAARYLAMLSEETVRRAWGEVTDGTKRDIALAAVILSRRFEERASESLDTRTFIMRLMEDMVSDFSEARGISRDSAAELLGDVALRDRVFEFDEAISAYEESGGSDSLDRTLTDAVDSRRQRAGWSDHWSNG